MRKTVLVMLSAFVMLMLVACGNKVDEATSEKYIAKAEEVVTLLNEANYSDIFEMFDEQMKAGLPVEDMEELTPIFEQSGEFEKINKSSVEEKDGNYIVVLAANYSEENRVFTISFNTNDEVVGLFIK